MKCDICDKDVPRALTKQIKTDEYWENFIVCANCYFKIIMERRARARRKSTT